jgi:hypothetical protein
VQEGAIRPASRVGDKLKIKRAAPKKAKFSEKKKLQEEKEFTTHHFAVKNQEARIPYSLTQLNQPFQ